MYYKRTQGYYDRRGNQHCRRAPFLILLQDKDAPIGPENFKGIVRKVALTQWGHFMMGSARISNETITMDGSYGNMGLPVSVSKKIFDKGKPIPRELYDAWNKGGGHNSCGSEAELMAQWAKENFPEY